MLMNSLIYERINQLKADDDEEEREVQSLLL